MMAIRTSTLQKNAAKWSAYRAREYAIAFSRFSGVSV
jgi:hypothetical protein